jgi:hypothetical protein
MPLPPSAIEPPEVERRLRRRCRYRRCRHFAAPPHALPLAAAARRRR